MFRLLAVEGIELLGQSVVCERRELLFAVTTGLSGMSGGDSEGDVLLFAVFHGFGVSRETIEEGDWSRVGVTEVREEEEEGVDEREAIQESGK